MAVQIARGRAAGEEPGDERVVGRHERDRARQVDEAGEIDIRLVDPAIEDEDIDGGGAKTAVRPGEVGADRAKVPLPGIERGDRGIGLTLGLAEQRRAACHLDHGLDRVRDTLVLEVLDQQVHAGVPLERQRARVRQASDDRDAGASVRELDRTTESRDLLGDLRSAALEEHGVARSGWGRRDAQRRSDGGGLQRQESLQAATARRLVERSRERRIEKHPPKGVGVLRWGGNTKP